MGWATSHIAALKAGKTVQFRPKGQSMRGRIESGQLVTVAPVTGELHVGDIVLCSVHGSHYLHLISAKDGERVQISNNKNKINGWTNLSHVYGIVTAIAP